MVETRRRQIEDVASELFRANGYAATSVRDIARALDIQGASLYSHVTSKEDLLWAIVDRAARSFEKAAGGVLAEAPADDPVATLRALIRAHVAVETGDPEEASVFDREWRHLARARREEVVARRDAYEGRFRALIHAGVASGAFRSVDPAIAAAFILTALNAVPLWYRPGGSQTPAELADAYADLSLGALARAPRSPEEAVP